MFKTRRMNFTEYFRQEYYQKLLTPNGNNPVRNRADSLLKVFELLEEIPKIKTPNTTPEQYAFNILETGCCRKDHGELCFGDDGGSSYIFADFISKHHGRFASIDLSEENMNYTAELLKDIFGNKSIINTVAKKVEFNQLNLICGDSVKSIFEIPREVKFDLVYLDSMDVTRETRFESSMHHLKELTAVMKNLVSGSIIVVDDADPFFDGRGGKGIYVKEFFTNVGLQPVYEGYQLVYQLP